MTQIEQQQSDLKRNIIEFEKLMVREPQVKLEVKHYFIDGVYIRELYIPKDVILTGKIHKNEHFSMLSKGEVSVSIDDVIKQIQAPFLYITKAGTKRIIKAYEDSIWMTIHKNEFNETNLDKIEKLYVVETEEQYIEYCGQEPELPLLG